MDDLCVKGNLRSLDTETDFPTHGFVRVDEDLDEGAGFHVSRQSSLGSGSGDSTPQGLETLYGLYKSLQKDVASLESELYSLRKRRAWDSRWDRRYTKRLAVWGNLFLAAWIFFFHFFKTVRGHGKVRTKVLEFAKDIAYGEQKKTRKTFFKGSVAGLKQGVIFVFFSFLLTRPVSWARTLGVILASSWSFYLATFQNFLTWQNYSNVLFHMLFLSTSYKKMKPLPSLNAYLARRLGDE